MKLGIYGGTFSPPHIGHVRAARAFIEQIGLDKLLVVPANIPPHKSADGIVSARERLKLSKLAFEGVDKAEVSDIEIKRRGKSYTYDTLSSLAGAGDELYLLCGTDMMMTFDTWYRFEDIFALSTVVLAHRYVLLPFEAEKITEKIAEYREKYGARIIELDCEPIDISSTEIRELIMAGGDASAYLPEKVSNYIRQKGLYTSENLIGYLKKEAEKYESPERYAHSLGVLEECEYFCDTLGFSEYERRVLACSALLHDIAKDLPDGDVRALCDRHGITYKETPTLHQDAGAAFIEENYASSLGDMLQKVVCAVGKHTTGGNNMSLIDMTLFVADYTEAGRKYKSCIKTREYIHSECEKIGKKDRAAATLLLARAVYDICRQTIAHLSEKGAEIDPRTEATEALMRSLIKE